ncbi:MAG TPA: hypothetical protein VNW92_19635 [Polyangiaceae bacterium]|jgi:MYXO-CTERM domain-containing protein|nr:hypothetical protein [Polyangiaceae bacterium]
MKKIGFGVLFFVATVATGARAAVPAGYTGTPFRGTPWPIPGRIEFENFDDGAEGITWRVDDSTANFGQNGCAGNAYRTGVHPQICQTNTSPGENDLFSQGPMQGHDYPSDAMPVSMYLGYTHPADWVKLTVNVAQAGKYKLSSTWASEPGGAGGIQFQISFNDVLKASVMLTGTGGYHSWVEFPDFATVDLDAGVQVLEFAPKSYHLNYDYLQLSLILPDGGVDDGGGNAAGGASASGGASAGGGAGTASSASGGAAGSADASIGSGGSAGSAASTSGAGTDGGGTAGQLGSSAGGATSAGTAAVPNAAGVDKAGCGCRVGGGSGRSPGGGVGIVALICGVLVRRRRRGGSRFGS